MRFKKKSECEVCARIRSQRKRVLLDNEPLPEDISSPAFAAAPAIYSFNVPRYFTTQIRAKKFGKSHNRQITWFYAKDIPLHRDDRDGSGHVRSNTFEQESGLQIFAQSQFDKNLARKHENTFRFLCRCSRYSLNRNSARKL